MAFRTLITNPNEIPIFQSKFIHLTLEETDQENKLTDFRLNLSRLIEDNRFVNLNKDLTLSICGIKEDLRLEEDLCSVEEIKAMPQMTYQGKFNLRGKDPKFFLYFHSSKSIKYQAISQHFKGKKVNTNYVSLLPVEDLIGSTSIWNLELDELEGPKLQLNRDVNNIDTNMRSEVVWNALILPMCLQQGLNFLLEQWDESNEMTWQNIWKEFVRFSCGEGTLSEAPFQSDKTEEDRKVWVEGIVENWTHRSNFLERINLLEQLEGESE